MHVTRWRKSSYSNPSGNCVEIMKIERITIVCRQCGWSFTCDLHSEAAEEQLCNNCAVPLRKPAGICADCGGSGVIPTPGCHCQPRRHICVPVPCADCQGTGRAP